MKIFIDTNIFLDLILEREEHADHAEQLLIWCANGNITGITSAVSLVNVYYVAGWHKSKTEAKKVIRKLLSFVEIAETNHKDLLLALDSEFADFEDAVQYQTSLNSPGVKYIITRNKKDFKLSNIPALTAEEFIAKIEQ
ncbi:type II toxin-antitoxin system VapC family toxin [Pinibacter aurantiacus]|uniref:PIN domain-containing protein n=1 Tax=Pinibacter aurantiacus TaxID=2851599 RepID=A0A9E2W7C4_9BACT|nr:PIN domain-containing protein [Pinibacter aurantiacus]MBV4356012.1 PIN domain-containing protein [Pinibacter aurantiacus]